MKRTGAPVLKRPVAPVVPQRASGAVVNVSSNLIPVERVSGISLHSYFPADGEKDVKNFLHTTISTGGWILSENDDAIYSIAPLAFDHLIAGPVIDADLLDPLRMFKLVQRVYDQPPYNVFPVVAEGSRSKLAVRIEAKNFSIINSIPLIEFFSQTCGNNIGVFNDLIAIQRKQKLRIACSHYTHGKPLRKYCIQRMVPTSARSQLVFINEESMSVEKYFSSVHGIQLKFPELPLLVDDRERFFPLELCVTQGEVRLGKDKNTDGLREFMQSRLCLELSRFGLSIQSTEPLKTRGRQLQAPARPSILVNREIIIPVFSFMEVEERWFRQFFQNAQERIGAIVKYDGIHRVSMERYKEDLREGVARFTQKPDLILILLDQKLEDSIYAYIKSVLDLRLQIPSQMLVLNAWNDSESAWSTLMTHLALKVGPALPPVKPSGTSIGAIATRGISSLGIKLIGCTLSFDNGMSVFLNRVRAQEKKLDFDFDEMFYEVLLTYFAACRNFPNRIIMFVSQPETSILFSCVSGIIRGVHAAVSRVNRELRTGINVKLGTGPEINPNWTFILCDSRSGVQIHSESKHAIVASSGIVPPYGIQFFIQSATPGSKSVKYSVIHDANVFTIPEIQNFTQQICSLDGSLPIPMVHADKLLDRAECYMKAEKDLLRGRSPKDSSDIVNQKLLGTENSPLRFRSSYM
jgi:hypothetical protein